MRYDEVTQIFNSVHIRSSRRDFPGVTKLFSRERMIILLANIIRKGRYILPANGNISLISASDDESYDIVGISLI